MPYEPYDNPSSSLLVPKRTNSGTLNRLEHCEHGHPADQCIHVEPTHTIRSKAS